MEPARAATIDDIDSVVELARALHDELRVMRGGELWELREARVAPDADAFRAFLARSDALVVVGTIDGTVVGYGIVEIEALRDGTRLGVIGDLYVEPGAREVAVGEEIATALVAFCSENDVVGVDAFALPGHREAKNFFERAGFTARALLMHKRL